MKATKQKEELKSRREFFKAAAKGVLPILGLTILGPTILTSCDKLEDITGCSDCADSCKGGCESGCKGTCSTSCAINCRTACYRVGV